MKDAIQQIKRLCIKNLEELDEKHNESQKPQQQQQEEQQQQQPEQQQEQQPEQQQEQQQAVNKLNLPELAADILQDRTSVLKECFEIIGHYLSTSSELVARALRQSLNTGTCRRACVSAYAKQLEVAHHYMKDLSAQTNNLCSAISEERFNTLQIVEVLSA
jgi:signal recognition particle GTPase